MTSYDARFFETGIFANLRGVRDKIAIHASYKGHWYTCIQGSLRSEKFCHDIAGLKYDIRSELTEAGRRQQVCQGAASLVSGDDLETVCGADATPSSTCADANRAV